MNRCGHMRLALSDTTVRPMRHVSDTKNCFSATALAAPSYEFGTSGPAVVPLKKMGLPSPKLAQSWHGTNGTTFRYERTRFSYGKSPTPATKTHLGKDCHTTRHGRPAPCHINAQPKGYM